MGIVNVEHHLGDLVRDLKIIPKALKVRGAAVARKNADQGNLIAKRNAKRTAGDHGKHYVKRFTVGKSGPMSYEYGPSGHPQGEMSFEYGSRNQPPHLDLNKSADRQAPKFYRDVDRVIDDLFWPGGD